MKIAPLIVSLLAACATLHAADTDVASNAINTLGIDLLARTNTGGNALLSPYSIQAALAMTYAGASGGTREQMAKALHFPADNGKLCNSFEALGRELADIHESTKKMVEDSEHGGAAEPVTLAVANRLYGQQGYDFHQDYLGLLKQTFGAPLEQVDFKKGFENARKLINAWVGEQTENRIHDLIPTGGLTEKTRLVLVNAIYLKAAWNDHFLKEETKPLPFQVNGADSRAIPTMTRQSKFGYAKKNGFAAVALPYIGGDLQFLILLPDDANGLPALEKKLTPALLAECAKLDPALVELWMPKFKMEPPLMELGDELKALGMKSAFDEPRGSADFGGIATCKPDDYLYISAVFHKTFLSLDEEGTEAAAATAVVMMVGSAMPIQPPKVIQVHVNHPFLFAIQDCKSGACLFLGRVTDPRSP